MVEESIVGFVPLGDGSRDIGSYGDSMPCSDPEKKKEIDRLYRLSKKKVKEQKSRPTKPWLCQGCGETEPTKFDKGAKSTCKTCAAIERSISKKQRNRGDVNIYFIQVANSDGYIKIGCTTDIGDRLANDGGFTDNPYPLTILFLTEKTVQRMERIIHQLCKKEQIRGEWFYPHQEVFSMFDRIKREGLGWLEDIAHPNRV